MIINTRLITMPNGKNIFLVKANALSVPRYFLHSHTLGLVSTCVLANAGSTSALVEKNRPTIPVPTKSKE